MQNGNLSFLDALTVLCTVLQLSDHESNVKQASHDDIMKVLTEQNKTHLEKILENQERILERLETLERRAGSSRPFP